MHTQKTVVLFCTKAGSYHRMSNSGNMVESCNIAFPFCLSFRMGFAILYHGLWAFPTRILSIYISWSIQWFGCIMYSFNNDPPDKCLEHLSIYIFPYLPHTMSVNDCVGTCRRVTWLLLRFVFLSEWGCISMPWFVSISHYNSLPLRSLHVLFHDVFLEEKPPDNTLRIFPNIYIRDYDSMHPLCL